jgi:hypothetical protein
LLRRDNNAFLPQDDEQVSQSLGELRSLAIGVSRRDAFVEPIDVTADELLVHGG